MKGYIALMKHMGSEARLREYIAEQLQKARPDWINTTIRDYQIHVPPIGMFREGMVNLRVWVRTQVMDYATLGVINDHIDIGVPDEELANVFV